MNTRSKVKREQEGYFHDWLTGKKQSVEKEKALFDLWSRTESEATGDTLSSLSDLLTRFRTIGDKRCTLRTSSTYVVLILVLVGLPLGAIILKNYFPNHGMVEVYSPPGATKKLDLPDGSYVHLNAGTVLLYPESYGSHGRMVYLSGEAYFKVKNDSTQPFIVQVKDFSVTVTGTEFDVMAYADDPLFKTTLISGQVRVRNEFYPEEVLLKDGDQLVHNHLSHRLVVEQIDLYDATAWQWGELVFKGATSREILNVLERKYAVSFQYKASALSDDKYNFRFSKETSLLGVLDIIREVADDFDYTVKDDSYYIHRKK